MKFIFVFSTSLQFQNDNALMRKLGPPKISKSAKNVIFCPLIRLRGQREKSAILAISIISRDKISGVSVDRRIRKVF